MGYMNGINQKGLEFVAKVTKLLNSLTEEDFEDTYAYIKVLLVEENHGSSEERILGYWLDEHGPGHWSYFDGPPQNMRKDRTETYKSVRSALAKECPTGSTVDDDALNRMTASVLTALNLGH